MQLQPGDILARSEQGGKTLWVRESILVETCKISTGYMRTWARPTYRASLPPSQRNFDILPDNGNAWRWARINGFFYYALDRIPNRAPKFYRDQLPTRAEMIDWLEQSQARTKAEIMQQIKDNITSVVDEFFTNADTWYYLYDSQPTFSHAKASQLAEAKAWCDMMAINLEGGRFRRFGVRTKEEFYRVCAEIIQEKQLEGMKLNTVKSLRKKIHYYPALPHERRQYLVSGKYGNNNALIVGKFKLVDTNTGEEMPFDIHQTLIFNLYMNPGGPEKEDMISLWEEYKNWLEEWTTDEPVAYRTFTQYCSRFDNQLLMAKARHGDDYYNKHYLTYVPAEQLQYAHSLFAADGSATVAYKYYDPEGKCCRMNLYAILISDVASRYISGWAPAREGLHNETPAMTAQAVRMAVESGGYQTMFELVTDNHGAFTSAESRNLLTSVFEKVRTIRVNNSQANPAETQFRLFKKTLKRFSNFLRSSWSAGIHNQANPDFIPNNELLPTYEEAIEQMHRIVNDWNNRPMRDGTTPAQRFENKHPECQPIDDRKLRRVFGYSTAVEITRMRGFVEVWKGHSLHKFEIPDYYNGMAAEISKATGYAPGAKVAVIWTPDAADIYSPEGVFICTCLPTKKASTSHAESNEQTDYAIGHHTKRQRIQLQQADEFEKAVVETSQRIAEGVMDGYAIAITDKNFSKETFNKAAEEGVNHNKPAIAEEKQQSRQRVDRDFDAAAWTEIYND